MSQKRKPRKWQSNAIEKFVTKKKSELSAGKTTTSFTGNYCPGAGKTDFSLMTMVRSREEGWTNFNVIVAPNVNVAKEWANKARRHGLNLHYSSMLPNWDDTPDGISITIQSLVANAPMWIDSIMLSPRRDFSLTVDEVHHMVVKLASKGEDDIRAWGRAMQQVRDALNPSWQLNLSGTVFRSKRSEQIVGIEYKQDENNTDEFIAHCDDVYGMRQGIADRVVRPVSFRLTDGKTTWMQATGLQVADFGEKLDKKGCSRRLKTALVQMESGSVVEQMLRLGIEELKSCRAGTTPHAAGHVIAVNTDHARELAGLLQKLTGKIPIVVDTKSEDKPNDLIEEFRSSDEEWIISVDMISEGVDIPRMRVQVYATNKLAELYVRQAWARVQRQQDSDVDETAKIILPADERLIKIAAEYEEAVELATKRPDDGPPPPPTPGDSWSPVSAIANEDVVGIYRGETVDADIVAYFADKARRLDKDPIEFALTMIEGCTQEEIDNYKRKGKQRAAANPETDVIKQKATLRSKIHKRVNYLAHLKVGKDKSQLQAAIKMIRNQINPGGGVEKCSVKELEVMLQQIELMIDATKGAAANV